MEYGDYIVYYTAPNGTTGHLGVSTGGDYETIEDFVEEFLFDHDGYAVDKIEKE